MPRLRSLDGVRCCAVLAVLVFHLNWRYSGGGWLGVDVFFVLSGYLITTILLGEHSRDGRIRLRTFYAKRALRLYPALLALMVVGLVFYPLLGDGGTLGGYGQSVAQAGGYVEDFVYGITGSPHGGFGHTWSLGVEEQFYVAWPLVMILVLRRGGSVLRWALAGTALSWVLLVVLTPRTVDPFYVPGTYFRPDTRASSLLVGCALAAWMARPRRALPGAGWAGAGLLIVVAYLANRYTRHTAMVPTIIAADLAACLLLYGLVTAPRGGLSRVLGARPLVWLGVRSYGVYLLLVPVCDVWGHYLHTNRGLELSVASAATILVGCAASYRWIEQPFLRRKQHLSGSAGAVGHAEQQPDDAVALLGQRLHLSGVLGVRRTGDGLEGGVGG